jgi:hypothetical protein
MIRWSMDGHISFFRASCEFPGTSLRVLFTNSRAQQLSRFHGLLHLLGAPMATSPYILQAHSQTASQMDQCVFSSLRVSIALIRCSFIRLVPTPFASHAFHPVDGYLQSVPYHLFIFLFPLYRELYLGLFVAVNFWSIFVSVPITTLRYQTPDSFFRSTTRT